MTATSAQQAIDRATGGPGRRFWLAAGGWALLIAILWGADLLARASERAQTGIGKDDFRLVSEQVTSALAVLLLVLFVARWLRLFPLRRDAWVPAVIGHTAGSLLFAFGHHVLMILLRLPWYAANGIEYRWREPFLGNLMIEYQKDIKVYFGIVLILGAWDLYRRTRPGRSRPVPGHLVVHTGTAERVLPVPEIESLEAARNYVAVHAGGREYILRDSISALLEQLPAGGFARTHRSHAVNLARVQEIRSEQSRQYIVLQSGRRVPLGRSHRAGFRTALAHAAPGLSATSGSG
jgi:hypothetical protein